MGLRAALAAVLCACWQIFAAAPAFEANASASFLIECNASISASDDNNAGARRVVDLFDYDVVIVGAGLSGAVLAQRHAELLHRRVLVLERRNHSAGNTCVSSARRRTLEWGVVPAGRPESICLLACALVVTTTTSARRCHRSLIFFIRPTGAPTVARQV
jgi:hypothetical protein